MKAIVRFTGVVDIAIMVLCMVVSIPHFSDYVKQKASSGTEIYVIKQEKVMNEPEQQTVNVIPFMETLPQIIQNENVGYYDCNWTKDEEYELAKIAMAEAEGETIQTKSLVIMTVLNRVNDKRFPNSIHEVIFQKNQFSCINGRYEKVEPNEDCYTALNLIKTITTDYSGSALYFESTDSTSLWHRDHLQFLYQSDDMRFYK